MCIRVFFPSAFFLHLDSLLTRSSSLLIATVWCKCCLFVQHSKLFSTCLVCFRVFHRWHWIDRWIQFMGIYGCSEVIFLTFTFQPIDRKFIQISNDVSFCFHFVRGQIHLTRSCAKIAVLIISVPEINNSLLFGFHFSLLLSSSGEMKEMKNEIEVHFECEMKQWKCFALCKWVYV